MSRTIREWLEESMSLGLWCIVYFMLLLHIGIVVVMIVISRNKNGMLPFQRIGNTSELVQMFSKPQLMSPRQFQWAVKILNLHLPASNHS